MSIGAVNQVLDRLDSDEEFRQRCATDPDAALGDYDLSDEERAALLDGDAERLQAVGVDTRRAKGMLSAR